MNKLTLTLKQYDQLTYCITRTLDASRDPSQLFHELVDEQKIGESTYESCILSLEDYLKVIRQMRRDKLSGKRVSSLYSYSNMDMEETTTEGVLKLLRSVETPKNMKLLALDIQYPEPDFDPYAGLALGPKIQELPIKPDHKPVGGI